MAKSKATAHIALNQSNVKKQWPSTTKPQLYAHGTQTLLNYSTDLLKILSFPSPLMRTTFWLFMGKKHGLQQ